MPTKRPPLITGEIYHLVTKAVEGTNLFSNESDYLRMINNLFEFNDQSPVNWRYRKCINPTNSADCPRNDDRDLLVDIMAFCLMPNHVHLLIRQVQDNGISKFMRKTGTGFVCYKNKKYNRSGHLFQGRFKAVHVKDDRQLMTTIVYIHSNPVAIICPGWKEKGIDNPIKTMNFLKKYKWSSFLDCIGTENFPSLINRNFTLELLGGEVNSEKFVEDWLFHKKELYDFDNLAIE